MPTFKYAKLVRDNIPGWHRANGHTVDGRTLAIDELYMALCEKLHEEADEISGTKSREEQIEEIGDAQQIIDDLCTIMKISKDELAETMKKKTDRKGGFTHGEYIETVTIPNEDDKWAQYCRKSPEKYPEVNEKEENNE